MPNFKERMAYGPASSICAGRRPKVAPPVHENRSAGGGGDVGGIFLKVCQLWRAGGGLGSEEAAPAASFERVPHQRSRAIRRLPVEQGLIGRAHARRAIGVHKLNQVMVADGYLRRLAFRFVVKVHRNRIEGVEQPAIQPKRQRLLTEERRQKIKEVIEQQGRITVDDIAVKFKVSAVTARGDLEVLAERGDLIRSHGGAVRQLSPTVDYPLRFKETIHHAEKVRIGHAAAQLVKPYQTVILDSGTTTAQVARQLKSARIQPLTVITNALNIAYELAESENISLIMIGGILRHASSSLVGPQAERMLQDLHADHFFLAVDGLDPDEGFSTPDILEAQLNNVMIRVSSEVTVVADASKFGRRSLSSIGNIRCAQRIITDNRADSQSIAKLRDKGLEVILV